MDTNDHFSLNTEKNSPPLLPFYAVGIFLAVSGLAIWIWYEGINQELFLAINHQHILLPDQIWKAVNFLTYIRMLILPSLLLLLALFFRRDLLLNVVVLIILYFIVFAGLKHVVAEARPYMVLTQGSFYWINQYEDAIKSAHLSFPSGHTGNIAIFAFGLNYMFFARNKPMQFIMLLLVLLTAFSRICTGWHWPLDVIASGLIGYLLVKISFSINIWDKLKRRQYESY